MELVENDLSQARVTITATPNQTENCTEDFAKRVGLMAERYSWRNDWILG